MVGNLCQTSLAVLNSYSQTLIIIWKVRNSWIYWDSDTQFQLSWNLQKMIGKLWWNLQKMIGNACQTFLALLSETNPKFVNIFLEISYISLCIANSWQFLVPVKITPPLTEGNFSRRVIFRAQFLVESSGNCCLSAAAWPSDLTACRHLESFEPGTAYRNKFSLLVSFIWYGVRCVVAHK